MYQVVAVMAFGDDMSSDKVGWTLLSTDVTQVKRIVFLHTAAKSQHRQTWNSLEIWRQFEIYENPMGKKTFTVLDVPS